MLSEKWYGQHGYDKEVLTKWYADEMLRTKRYSLMWNRIIDKIYSHLKIDQIL